MTAVPIGLAINVEPTSQGFKLRVLGRGMTRGPASIFSFFAIFLLIITGIALGKSARSGQFTPVLVSALAAAVVWLIAMWRGKVSCEFEATQAELTVCAKVPGLGRIYVRRAKWVDIQRIDIGHVVYRSPHAPDDFVLVVRRINGAEDKYLRGYPVEGLKWLAETLDGSRLKNVVRI